MPEEHQTIAKIEHGIRRIGFPLIGIGGIIYEELTTVDPLLLGAYLALTGLGATTWVRDYYAKKGGGNDTR